MRKRFFTVMAAALVVSGIPVMAKETSTEEKISEAVEETKDSTEAESVVSGNEDRISEIEKQIHDLEKQIAVLKEERKQLRESNVTEIGDVIYQDESVIITYNGIKEDEYVTLFICLFKTNCNRIRYTNLIIRIAIQNCYFKFQILKIFHWTILII